MRTRNGFLLVGVLFAFLLLMIIVPVMVKWVQNDMKLSVKDQKASISFSLAEAAVDRGYWKVKSSTSTFNQVSLGNPLSGYNFDATYSDISGGTYRIMITSGPEMDQITVYGEGRDIQNNETRAIKAVYTNTSVPGSILSGGNLSAGEDSTVHWGPIMARGDVTLTGTQPHYPRKLAMGTVNPYDTNGTNPPNTDSLEWWSNYNVPELPVFDFTTMRSSAAASHTLDCQDVYTTYISTTYTPSPATCGSGKSKKTCKCTAAGVFYNCTSCTGHCDAVYTTKTNTTPTMQCCDAVSCDYGGTGCTDCTVTDIFHQTALRDKDYTWYWDQDVTWQGYTGIKGTVVVMGNMSILGDKDDRYCRSNDSTNSLPASPGCTVPVPPNAWKEYQKFDTTSSNEYPGDTGFHKNAQLYKIGTLSMESSGSGGDLGVYGFLYVAGDFTRDGATDIYGSMWVVGNVKGNGNTMVFYNSKLNVPTLNVVLERESWEETKPEGQGWN